jgi:hypothetical protein
MNTMSTHRGARAHAPASSSLPYIACHSRAYRPVLLKQVRQQAGNQHICKAATRDTYDVGSATNIAWQEGGVSKVKKETMLQQQGCILWFTGLSGSGKSTIACTLEHALCERGHTTALLDGDNVRHGLNKDLGFSAEDRQENIRRVGEVAKLFAGECISLFPTANFVACSIDSMQSWLVDVAHLQRRLRPEADKFQHMGHPDMCMKYTRIQMNSNSGSKLLRHCSVHNQRKQASHNMHCITAVITTCPLRLQTLASSRWSASSPPTHATEMQSGPGPLASSWRST